MKPFVVDRTSWHYRLALKINGGSYGMPQDFCSYVRLFFLGALLGLFAVAVAFLLVLGIAAMLTATVVGLYNGFYLILLPWLVGAGALWWVFRRKTVYHSQPSFLGQAYRSYKDRYCMKVEYK